MMEMKKINVILAGGVAAVEVEVIPGETVEQLIPLVAPQLGVAENGQYELLGPSNVPMAGDVFYQVKDGDKLTLAPLNTGG